LLANADLRFRSKMTAWHLAKARRRGFPSRDRWYYNDGADWEGIDYAGSRAKFGRLYV
jgi:hypothetical protein